MSDDKSKSTWQQEIDARDYINSIFGSPSATVASIDGDGKVTE